MNRLKYTGVLALAMVVMTAGSAPAQQPQPCAMMKDHQMGGMQQQGMPGMGMGMKQDKEMGGMQGCMMMEDMKNQQQLMQEMKKHMRMMDEMMEMMMQRRQGMAPQGGGSEQQEHHPAESK